MNWFAKGSAIFTILIFLGFSSLVHAQMNGEYVPGEVIVKLKESASMEQAYTFVGKAQTDKNLNLKNSWGKMKMYHFALKPGQTVEQQVEMLNQDPDVEYAEPNWIVEKTNEVGILETYTPSEIEDIVSEQGLEALGIDESVQSAWSKPGDDVGAMAGSAPVVAVIDTGLDLTHPVFTNSGSIWSNSGEIAGNGIDDDGNGYVDDVNGWNFVSGSGSMYDDDGHGTHVSGIVLGVDQNIHVPVASLSQAKIRIMPLKFLNGSGTGSTSNAIQAIYYAVNNGATVLNNSWGGTSYSASLHEAVVFAYNRGVVFIAAAGNSGDNNDMKPMYPASYDVPNVIAVAATTDSFTKASFSNYGKASVYLGAWGYYINSTIPGGGFGDSSGTSMAAPFVAGTAAQMKVQSPNMLGYQIKAIVGTSSEYRSSLAPYVKQEGRLHPTNTINAASVASVDSSQPVYSANYSGNRELASEISGGGCGMVEKLTQYKAPPGTLAPKGPQSWYVLLIVGIILLPIIIATHLRARAPENRRQHDRFVIDSSVRMQVGDKEFVGAVSSISLGGLKLDTSELLEQGGIVNMTIQSPSGEEQVQVQGRVVWREEKKAYGVAFQDTPMSALDSISSWTKNLKKAS